METNKSSLKEQDTNQDEANVKNILEEGYHNRIEGSLQEEKGGSLSSDNASTFDDENDDAKDNPKHSTSFISEDESLRKTYFPNINSQWKAHQLYPRSKSSEDDEEEDSQDGDDNEEEDDEDNEDEDDDDEDDDDGNENDDDPVDDDDDEIDSKKENNGEKDDDDDVDDDDDKTDSNMENNNGDDTTEGNVESEEDDEEKETEPLAVSSHGNQNEIADDKETGNDKDEAKTANDDNVKTANFSDRETDTGLAGELMDENLVEASRELFKEMADIAGEPEPLVPLHAPEQGREAVEDFVKKKMAAAL
jgi:hypothetical protein